MKNSSAINFDNPNNYPTSPNIGTSNNSCPCSVAQLLAIAIPLSLLGLFCAIFLPIYLTKHNHHNKIIVIRDNRTNPTNNTNTDIDTNNITGNLTEEEFDEFDENVTNLVYATLTPKNGYDNILIFLNGITEVSNKYFDYFKSNKTFIPRKTKIYSLAGRPRRMRFVEYYYNYSGPVPGWFDVDHNGVLYCDNCSDLYDEAKESLNLVLDSIDQIAYAEQMSYDKIYLAGFSQGAIMVNYVLLNSRHKLGGYLAFSGYVFDHDLHYNQIIHNLTDSQKEKINSKKDYHIIATLSFNDDGVFYQNSAASYSIYYKEYTDFRLYSFGNLLHVLSEQPVLPHVKLWLKESMGK